MRSHAVRAAVTRALAHHRRLGADAAADVDTVVTAVARFEQLPITVRGAQLPFGTCGRWIGYPDGRQVLEVADGHASRDWTIAHELGHLMLGHGDDPERRSCKLKDMRAERQAERFASMLTSRLAVLRRSPTDSIFL